MLKCLCFSVRWSFGLSVCLSVLKKLQKNTKLQKTLQNITNHLTLKSIYEDSQGSFGSMSELPLRSCHFLSFPLLLIFKEMKIHQKLKKAQIIRNFFKYLSQKISIGVVFPGWIDALISQQDNCTVTVSTYSTCIHTTVGTT